MSLLPYSADVKMGFFAEILKSIEEIPQPISLTVDVI